MPVVNRTRTALSDEELLNTLRDAYYAEFGVPIHRARMATLWSVLAFEHGAGADPVPEGRRAAWKLWNWNWGNRRGIEGDAGYYMMSAIEHVDGERKSIVGRWPAYSSHEVGMRTWLRMMSTRYRAAWVASLSGNAMSYSLAAKAGGYFTAPVLGPKGYANGVRTWMKIFFKRWPPS